MKAFRWFSLKQWLVAFDSPYGPRNIIRDEEDGLLVDYLNPQALADGICRLIEDESLRKQFGARARENVLRYSKNTVMKQWEEFFKQITRIWLSRV